MSRSLSQPLAEARRLHLVRVTLFGDSRFRNLRGPLWSGSVASYVQERGEVEQGALRHLHCYVDSCTGGE